MHRILAIVLGMVLAAGMALAQEIRPLVTAKTSGPNLLKDDAWRPIAPAGASRTGGTFTIDNGADATAPAGFQQSIALNQDRPMPIVAEVESRAFDVGGEANSDYSLYLDILYTDGTPLWGQIATFPTGTVAWQRRQVVVLPEKPVRTVACYLLLRRHTGKAEFREPVLAQVTADDVAVFDGLLVHAPRERVWQFLIRDVGANSGFTRDASRQHTGELTHSWESPAAGPNDPDRALTVVYIWPLPAGNWKWLHDPTTTTTPLPRHEYMNTVACSAGARRLLSRYPFAAVADGKRGYGLMINLKQPAVYRAGYAPDTRELYVAFDIAVTREQAPPSVAAYPFEFDGTDGFRGALARYHQTNPDAFHVRVKRQGLWMPFAAISRVQGWEDFGFAFKEGNDETKWDDEHGILTFRYTEPLTWWMALPPGTPRSYDEALTHARKLADGKKPDAQAFLTSGYHNAAGQFPGRFEKQPWCDGVVWSMNSAPGIAGQPSHFSTKWSPAIRDTLYGPQAAARLDGEYIDSSEGYVTDELDFNRAHFSAMQTPLTFDPTTHRPAIFRGLIAFEYIRAIAEDVHAMDLYMMANGTPGNLPWLAPLLDVMGTETDWNPGGKWRPMPIEELLYRRAMCGRKPYCFLMNTDFEQFGPDLVEKYMQRCMAFGMFPGFFSHNASEKQYFQNPALYNRDRPLFLKYIPLCKRLAEAGWQPLTQATSSNPAIHLERFGDRYLTALNTSNQPQKATVQLHWPKPPTRCTALPGNRAIKVQGSAIDIELRPEEAVVLEIE